MRASMSLPAALAVGVTTTALVAVGASPSLAAEPPIVIAPQVVVVPVTSDRVVVAVDAGTREDLTTAVVRDLSGHVLGRATFTEAGKGVVPLTIAPSSKQTLKVTLTNATGAWVPPLERTVTAATTPAALQTSLWRVVNKRTPMVANDQPPTTTVVQGVPLEPRAAAALQQLLGKARAAGQDVYPSNGYRSYAWQGTLYSSYARRDGVAEADKISARPGFSEHQTGLAFDAKSRRDGCDLESCFGTTRSGRFLAAHAAESGFVVRYTPRNSTVTGYSPEPWHLRYVGRWLSAYLVESGKTSLEDAFAMPAAPGYR